MLILGPRAVERLETYKPAWPLPKIFRLTKGGKLNEGIFAGETINTPSMLCVEDYLDALQWAKAAGGLDATVKRSDANAKAIADWVKVTPWIDHLALRPEQRSNTSVCLKVVDPAVTALSADAQAAFAKNLAGLLEKEDVAYDIANYRDAPPDHGMTIGDDMPDFVMRASITINGTKFNRSDIREEINAGS